MDNKQLIIDQEIYKQCPINPIYYINKKGQIYSTFKKDFLKWNLDLNGYPRVDMYTNGKQKHFKVHRLVWLTWMGKISNAQQINHKDDNKMNPALDNLYLGTQKENIQDCKNNQQRVGHMYSLKLYDKQTKQILTFCPANTFIPYSGHSCSNGSISRIMTRNWFQDRYQVIYYKKIEDVTTMTDECKSVE